MRLIGVHPRSAHSAKIMLTLTAQDIDEALTDYGETLDISRAAPR